MSPNSSVSEESSGRAAPPQEQFQAAPCAAPFAPRPGSGSRYGSGSRPSVREKEQKKRVRTVEREQARDYSRNAAKKKAASRKAKRRKKIVATLMAVILAALVICAGLCAWTIWWRFDDALDMQGTWQTADGAIITIDETQIHLTDDVAYTYVLDTMGKKVDYSFGQSAGHATYRFSADRTMLVIDEVNATNWLVVLGVREDPALAGEVPVGVSVFTRVVS